MISLNTLQTGRFLKEFSTFGIGGPARYFLEVRTIQLMQEVILFCLENHLSYLIIGKGSNSLFADKGCEGIAILNKIDFIEQNGSEFHVGAPGPKIFVACPDGLTKAT